MSYFAIPNAPMLGPCGSVGPMVRLLACVVATISTPSFPLGACSSKGCKKQFTVKVGRFVGVMAKAYGKRLTWNQVTGKDGEERPTVQEVNADSDAASGSDHDDY